MSSIQFPLVRININHSHFDSLDSFICERNWINDALLQATSLLPRAHGLPQKTYWNKARDEFQNKILALHNIFPIFSRIS